MNKKRMMLVILSIVFCLSLFSTTAFAAVEEYDATDMSSRAVNTQYVESRSGSSLVRDPLPNTYMPGTNSAHYKDDITLKLNLTSNQNMIAKLDGVNINNYISSVNYQAYTPYPGGAIQYYCTINFRGLSSVIGSSSSSTITLTTGGKMTGVYITAWK